MRGCFKVFYWKISLKHKGAKKVCDLPESPAAFCKSWFQKLFAPAEQPWPWLQFRVAHWMNRLQKLSHNGSLYVPHLCLKHVLFHPKSFVFRGMFSVIVYLVSFAGFPIPFKVMAKFRGHKGKWSLVHD